jgi:FKBP-type peptidyl-prolyl cis-trans isomerase FklB
VRLRRESEVKTSTLVKILAVGVVLSGCAFAGENGGTKETGDAGAAKPPLVLESENDKLSYAIGLQIGQSFKRQGLEVNRDVLFRAIEDVLTGRELSLSDEDAGQVLRMYSSRMLAEQRQRMEQESPKARAEGEAFLKENKTKPGVVVLPSGLQYKILEKGSGRSPGATDRVKVHYRGTLVNGTEFDSSYSRGQPAEFGVSQVIKGWTEGLQLMKEGGKWQLFIPSELAYGASGRPPTIPPSSVLIFEVELIEVLKAQ